MDKYIIGDNTTGSAGAELAEKESELAVFRQMIDSEVKRINSEVIRLEMMANMLFGSEPPAETACESDKRSIGDGQYELIRNSITNLSETTTRINYVTSRFADHL